jgi:hypothetical protein
MSDQGLEQELHAASEAVRDANGLVRHQEAEVIRMREAGLIPSRRRLSWLLTGMVFALLLNAERL